MIPASTASMARTTISSISVKPFFPRDSSAFPVFFIGLPVSLSVPESPFHRPLYKLVSICIVLILDSRQRRDDLLRIQVQRTAKIIQTGIMIPELGIHVTEQHDRVFWYHTGLPFPNPSFIFTPNYSEFPPDAQQAVGNWRLGRENKYSWGIPDNEGFVTFKKKSSERCLQYIFSAFRNKRRPAASAERLCLKSFFPAGPVYSSARAVRPFPSGFTSITMVFPARTPSFKIRRAASVSTFFWRYRFKGRAPYTGS